MSADVKEDPGGISGTDCGWTDRRLARWPSDEGWRLRCNRRHYAWHPRRLIRRLDFPSVGNLARRRNNWFHHCGIRRRGDTGLDYSFAEENPILGCASVTRRLSHLTVASRRNSLIMTHYEVAAAHFLDRRLKRTGMWAVNHECSSPEAALGPTDEGG